MVIILTLCNSNYQIDIFNFLYFEYFENIFDSYDENNKINIALVCFLDFIISVIYSRIVFHIFNRISKVDSNNTIKK